MPKIIPDLGPRILETAARHFETKGYDATDMKTLATELGISVGTLYNYHASKPELFLAVSLLWKDQLNARMLARFEREDTSGAKLRAALLMLYEDMEAFTGIWKEFMRSGARFPAGSAVGERFKADNDQLYVAIQGLFHQVWKDRPHTGGLVDDPDGRLGQLMVGSIMQLVMNGNDDRQANREFVRRWIDFIAPADSEAHRNGL